MRGARIYLRKHFLDIQRDIFLAKDHGADELHNLRDSACVCVPEIHNLRDFACVHVRQSAYLQWNVVGGRRNTRRQKPQIDVAYERLRPPGILVQRSHSTGSSADARRETGEML